LINGLYNTGVICQFLQRVFFRAYSGIPSGFPQVDLFTPGVESSVSRDSLRKGEDVTQVLTASTRGFFHGREMPPGGKEERGGCPVLKTLARSS